MLVLLLSIVSVSLRVAHHAEVLAEKVGLSVAEVAHATGVPENTVKQRAFRAREKLRSLLAALRPGATP